MKNTIIKIALLAAICAPALVMADDQTTIAKGFYVGLGAGYVGQSNTNKYFNDEEDADWGMDFPFAGRFFMGYKFTNHYALELGYQEPVDIDGGQTTTAANGNVLSQTDWHYKVSGYDLDFVYNQPFSGNNNVFGKVGLGLMKADIHDTYIFRPQDNFDKTQTGVVGIIGAGYEHYFWNHWAVGLEADYQTMNDYIPASTSVLFRTSVTF